ncbi:MAG: peptidoglycan DD-metalloendopeptidase family protein [bacterium]
MTRRAISIQLGDSERPGAAPRRWTLAGWRLAAAGISIFFAIALTGFFFVRFSELKRASRELERVTARNAELEATIKQLAEVENELETMRAMDAEMREWLGLAAQPGSANTGDALAASAATAANSGGGGGGAGAANSTGRAADGAAVDAPLSPGERAIVAEADPVARLTIDQLASIAQSAQLAWPIEGWVSSEFGEARAGDALHTGLDIVAPTGTPVLAAADGDVVVAGTDSQYGRLVSIEHADGLRTFYGHNASLFVSRGDRVVRGQQIATVGSTGRSTAPHLHFEVRLRRVVIDPRELLPPESDALAGNR